jgi:hypothetical protein
LKARKKDFSYDLNLWLCNPSACLLERELGMKLHFMM